MESYTPDIMRLIDITKDNFRSLSELAQHLGKSKGFFYSYKSTPRRPARSLGNIVLKDLEKILGINPTYIRTGKGDPYIHKSLKSESNEAEDINSRTLKLYSDSGASTPYSRFRELVNGLFGSLENLNSLIKDIFVNPNRGIYDSGESFLDDFRRVLTFFNFSIDYLQTGKGYEFIDITIFRLLRSAKQETSRMERLEKLKNFYLNLLDVLIKAKVCEDKVALTKHFIHVLISEKWVPVDRRDVDWIDIFKTDLSEENMSQLEKAFIKIGIRKEFLDSGEGHIFEKNEWYENSNIIKYESMHNYFDVDTEGLNYRLQEIPVFVNKNVTLDLLNNPKHFYFIDDYWANDLFLVFVKDNSLGSKLPNGRLAVVEDFNNPKLIDSIENNTIVALLFNHSIIFRKSSKQESGEMLFTPYNYDYPTFSLKDEGKKFYVIGKVTNAYKIMTRKQEKSNGIITDTLLKVKNLTFTNKQD